MRPCSLVRAQSLSSKVFRHRTTVLHPRRRTPLEGDRALRRRPQLVARVPPSPCPNALLARADLRRHSGSSQGSSFLRFGSVLCLVFSILSTCGRRFAFACLRSSYLSFAVGASAES